ncbi:SLATT domain-containing protein [Antarctobacter sp.]|uniref:SLATT domain-containing protein n=1 Tax=Antarctobacter sp. TaxID=1872577 RepID=UPI003A91BBCB
MENPELDQTGVNLEISRLAAMLSRNQRSQYASCESLEFKHFATGILMILASSVATVFFGLKWPSFETVSPLASLVALAAGSLQTFSKFEHRARDHKQAAVEFGILHRAARARLTGAYSEAENREFLESLLSDYADVSNSAPLTWYSKRRAQERLRSEQAPDS